MDERQQPEMHGVLLALRTTQLVRNLPGYRKGDHRIPEDVNDRTQRFVGRLGGSLVAADLDHVFQSLRTGFRFKRTDLATQETDEGSGSITTPFFRYTSCVYQHPRNADEAIWQRDVSEIVDANQLLSPGFVSVFGETFDTVELVPHSAMNLEKLIDHIEDRADPRVSLSYDRNITACEIGIEGVPAKIQVTKDVFQIKHPHPSSPRRLMDSLFALQLSITDFADSQE